MPQLPLHWGSLSPLAGSGAAAGEACEEKGAGRGRGEGQAAEVPRHYVLTSEAMHEYATVQVGRPALVPLFSFLPCQCRPPRIAALCAIPRLPPLLPKERCLGV